MVLDTSDSKTENPSLIRIYLRLQLPMFFGSVTLFSKIALLVCRPRISLQIRHVRELVVMVAIQSIRDILQEMMKVIETVMVVCFPSKLTW